MIVLKWMEQIWLKKNSKGLIFFFAQRKLKFIKKQKRHAKHFITQYFRSFNLLFFNS